MTEATSAARRMAARGGRGSWALFVLVLALGTLLRIQQLSGQWLTDDEWHAVHRIVAGDSYFELASKVGIADYSIPLALYYKLMAETVGLSELGMRLPMLVAGVLLVAGGFLWARRHFGLATAYAFGLLLAISPLLVNFSRVARPYAMTCLIAWLALLSLEAWSRRRRPWEAWSFGLLTVSGCWLHMAVAPFLLAPLAWVVAGDLLRARRGAGVRSLLPAAWLSAAVAGGVALLCLRPMVLSAAALATRVGGNVPTGDTWLGVWYMWLGTDSTPVVACGLALAMLGLAALRQRMPRLLGMAAIGLAATLASIYVAKPAWIHNALTFGRYLLPAQLLLLLAVALGIVQASKFLRPAALGSGLVALLPLAFLGGTPHQDLLREPNNFTLHYWYQFDYRKAHNPVRELMKSLPVDPLWDRLAEAPPGSLRLAVAGQGLPSYTVPDVRWQLRHRQYVESAQLSNYCNLPPYYGEAPPWTGFHLKNAVTLADPDTLRSHRIDYLVFDRKGKTPVEACIARYRREHGAPEYEDDRLVAFRVGEGG